MRMPSSIRVGSCEYRTDSWNFVLVLAARRFVSDNEKISVLQIVSIPPRIPAQFSLLRYATMVRRVLCRPVFARQFAKHVVLC